MGYIEQTDVGNVYITDINDWFATLSNLNTECKNYIDSEIRYKEILAEHDKQIREEVIEDILIKVEFEEKWLFACYRENGCKYSSKDIDIAFNGIKHHLRKLKEQK